MFRRTTRPSPFWPAAALLALLAAPHTLLAQDAQLTVRAEVTNRTAKSVEFALVGPDGKDLGPARSVQPGKLYQTSNRTLPRGGAKGYKWVVRDPDTGRVLKEVPADKAQQSITVGGARPAATFTPADSGAAQTPEKKGQGAPQSRADAAGSRQSAQTAEKKDLAAIKAEMIRLTNAERAKANLAPLVEDARLSRAAQKHTDLMAEKEILDHGLGGTSVGDRVNAEKFSWTAVDEIISRKGQPEAANAAEVVQRWMRSKGGHREAILTSRYTRIGVGVKYSSKGAPYYTEVFAEPRQ